MFLKNIRLSNFKCLDSLELDFGGHDGAPVRKTTFLVGENGTGKSAVLQAIAMITGGSEALRAIPGVPDAFIRHRKRFCEIEATITTAQGEDRRLFMRLERGQSASGAIAANRASLLPMDAALRHAARNYFTAGYGSGRRLDAGGKPASRGDDRMIRYSAIRSLFSRETILRPLDAWAEQIRSGGGSAGIQALREALNTFLPLEVRFKGFDKTTGALTFSTPDGTLPLDALSNGYQQMVAWVSDLLYHVIRTFGDYKDPMAARGLLLIDEIDLHLHPAWQRQIHAFLNNGLPNFQVIATTYSPLTAQQARRDELYALRRDEGGKVALVPFVGDPSWMLLHQLLMSPMFGLDTDESVRMESAKTAPPDAGPRKGRKSGTAKRSATESTSAPLPLNTRRNSHTEPEDLTLLQQINASLQRGNKGGGS